MKNPVSILFLTVFLMYHVGYLGYYWISQQQINQRWLESVEFSGYTKKISVPMSLPYWKSQSDYEYTSGKFRWEGKVYRKVKQKYSKGALHIILIEDRLTQKLNQSVADWVKSVTDSDNENSSRSTTKSFIKDYIHIPLEFNCKRHFTFMPDHRFYYHTDWLSFWPEVITPPPQLT